MNQTTYRGDEKNTVIWEAIAPSEPAIARRKRVWLVKGLVIVTLLLIWWSYYSVPNRLSFGKKSIVAHDGESQELDFDTVG
jgi:hypothetical protein